MAKYVTVQLVPDGTGARRAVRMPQWMLRAVVVFLSLIMLGMVVFFAFYGSVLRRAAITEEVMKENKNLRRYYYKVQLLEENLNEAREVVKRMTEMAGIDYEFPDFPDDSTLFAGLNVNPPAVSVGAGSSDWSNPAGLPIQGFVTQTFNTEDGHVHPGVDIACAVGTPVLATGRGVVDEVRFDSVYGNVVVLQHNDSVKTVYGHNEKILVQVGQEVPVGARVALSGNSGRSSAPHLHYEVRIHDKPIDPMENPYEETK